MRDSGAQQRVRYRQPPVVLNVAPAHLGAEPHAIDIHDDIAEARQPAQVDQQARRCKPEGEHRDQALTAGDQPCGWIGGEQGNRPSRVSGARYSKGGGFMKLHSPVTAAAVLTHRSPVLAAITPASARPAISAAVKPASFSTKAERRHHADPGTSTPFSRCSAVCFFIASRFSAWLRCRFFWVNASDAVSEIEPVIVSLLRKTSAG